MGIVINDILRGVLEGGDASAFAEVCLQALGNPPVSCVSRFEPPVALPASKILNAQASHKIFIGSGEEEEINPQAVKTALAGVDLTLVALAPYGKNTGRFLGRIIDEVQPDVIALDCCPVELSAHILYTFSLPSVLGLPVRVDIRHPGSIDSYLNKIFYPGNMHRIAVLKSWLNKIPLLPVGQPPKKKQLEFVPEQGYLDPDYLEYNLWNSSLRAAYRAFNEKLTDNLTLEEVVNLAREVNKSLLKATDNNITADNKIREDATNRACYIASRIMDVAAIAHVDGRKPRLMAVIDIADFGEMENILDLLRQGVLEEVYSLRKDRAQSTDMVMEGKTLDKQNAEVQEFIPSIDLAQELFQKHFAAYAAVVDNEVLPDAECHRLLTEIARRTRVHPEIVRGVSVRGTIAFEEIVRSMAEIRGGLNRESIGKAALIALPPRIAPKHKGQETAIINEIVKEVLYRLRFSVGEENNALSKTLKRLSAEDILKNLNPLEQAKLEGQNRESSDKMPSVVSENDDNRETLKRLEGMKFLKKDQDGRYSLTRKALEYLLDELKQKLQAGEISQDEYNQQKARLTEQVRNISNPQYRMSTKEMANTIMEMMDAQDKLWDREVNFSTMHVYYHIKENSEGATISAPKRDYNALKRLIDDLEKQRILLASEQSSGFILNGLALNVLLKYLMDHSTMDKGLRGLTGTGKAWTNERVQEIRRFSSGDAFRDISLRHTLKEIARQKKNLCDVRSSDFRVFLKQPRKPQYDIIICLDTSGSMGFHQKLTYARLVAAGLVQAALKDGNRVGIVAFSDHGQVTVPLTDKDKDSLLNCIAAVTPRGNTNIGDGIKSSREILFQNYNSNQKYIMLITDGQPTAISEKAFAHLKEMKEKDLTEESALLETRQAAARGIRVSVIHIAAQDEPSSSFIKTIAQVGKGKIRRISKSDDIKNILR